MEYKFTHSVVVMGQLAKESSRTPPSEGNSPFEYIDRSLTTLGRTSDVHSERMREEFLSQREFIAHQIKEVEIKVDGRFNEVEKRSEDAEEKMRARFKEVEKQFEDAEEKMHRRFKEADKKMDGRFNEVDKKLEEKMEKMDRRFNEVDKKLEEKMEKMDRRFNEVDKKIDGVDNKIRDYLNHMQKASRNSLRTRGWEEIYAVGSLDPHGGIQTPDYFPRNVRHFWRLKDATRSKSP
jgi:DNA anti-recombination protein RmuC